MGFFDDPRASGTISGAGSGALTGAAIGSVIPVIGTGIGALAGGLIGGLGGLFGGGAEKKQQDNLAAARARLQEAARQSYAQRMQDLDRGMAYFQPVNADLQRLYGQGAAIPQQNYAAMAPGTGLLNPKMPLPPPAQQQMAPPPPAGPQGPSPFGQPGGYKNPWGGR